MTCKTSIVDCLKNKGIAVKTFSSSVHNGHEHSFGIITNMEDHFHSLFEPNQWWGIDFKRTIGIHSYRIVTCNACNYVRNWTISLSHNNISYFNVDSHSGLHPNGTVYQLGKTYNARYLKISGNAPGCQTSTHQTLKNILAFNYAEFFGAITPVLSCKRKYQNNKYIIFITLLIAS